MRELPILFNTEMVRAIMDGRKTTTRRCVKFLPGENPRWSGYIKDGIMLYNGRNEPCCRKSQYQPGDILYVRETWCRAGKDVDTMYFEDSETIYDGMYLYKADGIDLTDIGKWHPSIHMPKEAARLWLKVTDVRVERLQEITEEQIITEGTPYSKEEYAMWKCGDKITCNANTYLRGCFMRLWDSTIKKTDLDRYGWDANPYVFVIEFEGYEK